MVEAIEGKVDAWMVSAVRDWFIFLIDVIHFFWFLLALILIVRGRHLRFNRMWPARALLALVAFLWPVAFTLTTNILIAVTKGRITHDQCCRLFVLTVHGIFEPLFCLLLLLLVKFQSNSCATSFLSLRTDLCSAGLSWCGYVTATAPAAPAPRLWLQGTMSGTGVVITAFTFLVPSVIYNVLWFCIYDLDPDFLSSPLRWGSAGPCTVPLWNLLSSSVYVAISVVLINIYTRRLQVIAMNKLMLSRLWWTRIMATVLLAIQLFLCWTTVIWRELGDMMQTIIFLSYYIDVSLLCVSMVWFLSVRPVLQDYAPRQWQEPAMSVWVEQERRQRKKQEEAKLLSPPHEQTRKDQSMAMTEPATDMAEGARKHCRVVGGDCSSSGKRINSQEVLERSPASQRQSSDAVHAPWGGDGDPISVEAIRGASRYSIASGPGPHRDAECDGRGRNSQHGSENGRGIGAESRLSFNVAHVDDAMILTRDSSGQDNSNGVSKAEKSGKIGKIPARHTDVEEAVEHEAETHIITSKFTI